MPGTTKSAWVAKEVVVADRGPDYFLHNNIGVGLVSSLGILRFSRRFSVIKKSERDL